MICPPARKGRQAPGPRGAPGSNRDRMMVSADASGNDHAQTGLMRGCGPGTPRPHPGPPAAPAAVRQGVMRLIAPTRCLSCAPAR